MTRINCRCLLRLLCTLKTGNAPIIRIIKMNTRMVLFKKYEAITGKVGKFDPLAFDVKLLERGNL